MSQNDFIAAQRSRALLEEIERQTEDVLLPEVEDAIKRVYEQLDALEREETIRARWSSNSARSDPD